jgi:hypothetical protein
VWDGGGHEGHFVPLVAVADLECGDSIRFLEAQQPETALVTSGAVNDADDVRAQVFQIGCACGWRSRRFYLPITATLTDEGLEIQINDAAAEGEALAIWRRHFDETAIQLERLAPYRGPGW